MKLPCKTWDESVKKRFKYAHLKRDGYFVSVVRSANGALSFWSSKPSNITLDARHVIKVSDIVPPAVTVCGELYLPGGTSSDVTSALAAHDKSLKFQAFAITQHPALTAQAITSLPLEMIDRVCAQLAFEFVPYLADKSGTKIIPAELLNNCNRPDCEGWVLKNGNLLDWYKLKPHKTIDLVVVGFNPGSGKNAGLIGSFNLQTTEGYDVGSCNLRTDKERRYFSERSEQMLGAVIEVAYQEVGNGGRLRFPVFVRVRDDKTKEQCSVSQDAELYAHWQADKFELNG